MSKTFLKPFYINLLQCSIQLEIIVKENLGNLSTRLNDGDYDIEKAKDYHYKEILKRLNTIKKEVDAIRENESQLDHLNHVDELTETEKKRYSYVQEKVKVFSRSECNLNTLHLKESRRASLMASQTSLNAWEKILQENEENVFKPATRVKNLGRKNKKLFSETYENFLEEKPDLEMLDSIEENDFLNVQEKNENRRSLIENEEVIGQCVEDFLSNNNILESIEHNDDNMDDLTYDFDDKNHKPVIVGYLMKDQQNCQHNE